MFRRLLLICVALVLWGCNNSTSLERGRSAAGPDAGLSPREMDVAQLLESNTPFEFEFELKDVAGNRLSKADFSGKVLIVDLWGTWCGPCRMEIPHFVALHRKFQDQGLAIVGLNIEQARDEAQAAALVRSFCKSEGVDYPCAIVTETILNQVPDLEGFPTTLFTADTTNYRSWRKSSKSSCTRARPAPLEVDFRADARRRTYQETPDVFFVRKLQEFRPSILQPVAGRCPGALPGWRSLLKESLPCLFEMT
jgi:thiol-disulfide isomerase/thioredoxin